MGFASALSPETEALPVHCVCDLPETTGLLDCHWDRVEPLPSTAVRPPQLAAAGEHRA